MVGNLMLKLTMFWGWLTAHPLSFGRMVLAVALSFAASILFWVIQLGLWVVSGWFIFLEFLAFIAWVVMLIINQKREYARRPRYGRY